jgi:hypothetical protein
MQSKLLAGTAIGALLALGPAAQANTLIGTIVGAYDQQCAPSACLTGIANPNVTLFASSGGSQYDTPSLFIENPTGSSFTSVQVTLTGTQDAAGNGGNGSSETAGASNPATITLALPTIAAHTVYDLVWGSSLTASGTHGINLFAYDYDDSLGGTIPSGSPGGSGGTPDPSGHHCGTGSGTLTSLCEFTGNFNVAFSATYLGGPISSDFGQIAFGSNAFVGWVGLDQDGLSETIFDAHTLTFPGTLAEIFTGTNQNGGGTTGVPEPGTLALIAGGLGALATARRRRKAKQA